MHRLYDRSDHARTGYPSNEGPAVGSPPVMNLQVEGSTFAPDGVVDFRCDVTGCR